MIRVIVIIDHFNMLNGFLVSSIKTSSIVSLNTGISSISDGYNITLVIRNKYGGIKNKYGGIKIYISNKMLLN